MFIQNRLGLIESVETMRAQEDRMNQIANNLANVDTAGYKREHVTFWEMLHGTQAGTNRVGKGVKALIDYRTGPAELTGNPLDVAIDGEGFFKVQTPDGVRYTRAGNFMTNDTGQLVTQDGYLVMGQGGTIEVNGRDFAVAKDGRILIDGTPVNQFDIVTFEDLNLLEKQGMSLFRLREGAQEVEPENLQVVQGALEQSNANTTVELTDMIDLHRNFQSQQKLVRIIDDVDGQAINTVGKLSG